jgi:hypothetical protein
MASPAYKYLNDRIAVDDRIEVDDPSALILTWKVYGNTIDHFSSLRRVDPVLVLALISTYSPVHRRYMMHSNTYANCEYGFVSDESTPDKIRLGLTGIRLKDAQIVSSVVGRKLDRENLYVPHIHLNAATAYLARIHESPLESFVIWDTGYLRRSHLGCGYYVSGGFKRIDRFTRSWNTAIEIVRKK